MTNDDDKDKKVAPDLPPGPAFIPYVLKALGLNPENPIIRDVNGVPDGYIWQPATDGTGEGWVRPRGGVK